MEWDNVINSFKKEEKKDETNPIICPVCKTEFKLVEVYFCDSCGFKPNKINYDDYNTFNFHEFNYCPYRRINHFNELLTQLQGKETIRKPIKKEVYNIIIDYLKDNNKNIDDLTNNQIRKILRDKKITHLNEHINYIKIRLGSNNVLKLSNNDEERIKIMFEAIQKPYNIYINQNKNNRKNFISYYFIIDKLIEKIKGDRVKNDVLPITKSKKKLKEYLEIWEFIKKFNNWI